MLWKHTPPSCFSVPHSPLFLLRLLKFTSCCTSRFCIRKGAISRAIPTHLFPVCWQRVGAPGDTFAHGATSEPAAWEAARGCLCPVLEGNFRKVKNELLNFTVKKSSLFAPVWFPRWTLAAFLLCWHIPTHCSGVQENIKCPCWRTCPQPTFPPGSVQRPAGVKINTNLQ